MVYFSDWEGNLCAPEFSFTFDDQNYTYGDVDGENGRLAAWPDLRMYDIVICVDDCSETDSDLRMVTPPLDLNATAAAIEIATTGQIAGYTSLNIFDAYCIPDIKAYASILDPDLQNSYTVFVDKLDQVVDSFSLTVNDLNTCSYLFIVWYD